MQIKAKGQKKKKNKRQQGKNAADGVRNSLSWNPTKNQFNCTDKQQASKTLKFSRVLCSGIFYVFLQSLVPTSGLIRSTTIYNKRLIRSITKVLKQNIGWQWTRVSSILKANGKQNTKLNLPTAKVLHFAWWCSIHVEMIWKYLEQNVLFPKDLNWIQHWVGRIGLLLFCGGSD